MRWPAIAVVLACAGLACACRGAPTPAPVSTTTTGSRPVPEPKGKKVVTETHIEILDNIHFVTGSATMELTSIPLLDAIASTLKGNPSIRLVAVQAFGTDALASLQERVGAARAQAIVDALVARGVERGRLIAEGEATPPAGVAGDPMFLILQRTP